jgi:hypothetical protein
MARGDWAGECAVDVCNVMVSDGQWDFFRTAEERNNSS